MADKFMLGASVRAWMSMRMGVGSAPCYGVAFAFTIAGSVVSYLRHFTIKLGAYRYHVPSGGTPPQDLPENSRGNTALSVEIRKDDGSGKPLLTAAGLMAYDDIPWYSMDDGWYEQGDILKRYPLWDMADVPIFLNDEIQLEPSTTYHIWITVPSTTQYMGWYPVIALGYSSALGKLTTLWTEAGGTWKDYDDYELEYSMDTDNQAGKQWHVVIDGHGFMTPNAFASHALQWSMPFAPKATSGDVKHSDLEYPYATLAQTDWSHGQGAEDFGDKGRYQSAVGINTTVREQAVLSYLPQWTYVDAAGALHGYRVDNVAQVQFPTAHDGWRDNSYVRVAVPFTVAGSGSYNIHELAFWLKTMGPAELAGRIHVQLYDDNAGSPGSPLKATTLAVAMPHRSEGDQYTIDVRMRKVIAQFGTPYSATKGTQYWAILAYEKYTNAMDLPSLPYYSGTDVSKSAGVTPKISYDGSSWVDWTGRDGDLVWEMNTEHASTEFDSNVKGFFEFLDYLWCWTDTKLYRYDHATDGMKCWEEKKEFAAQTISDVKVFADVMLVGLGLATNAQATPDGVTWYAWSALPGYTLSDTMINIFGTGCGYVWLSTAADAIRKWNGTTTADRSAAITVGMASSSVHSIMLYNGLIHVLKDDGIWYVDDENDVAHIKYYYSEHGANGTSAIEWNRELYYRYFSDVVRFSGAIVDYIGPNRDAGLPQYQTGWLLDTVGTPAFLYGLFGTASFSGSQSTIMAWNGIGWHALHVAAADQLVQAIHMTQTIATGQRLWWGEGTQKIGYMRLPSYSDNPIKTPWDIDGYVASGTLETPWLHCDLPQVDKWLHSVQCVCENMYDDSGDADYDVWIDVFIAINNNEKQRYLVGRITHDETTVLMLPPNLVGKTFKLVFVLNTNDVAKTPVLKVWALKYVLRPPITWGGTLRLRLGDYLKDMVGQEDSRTRAVQWSQLCQSALKKTPMTLFFPWSGHRVLVSNLAWNIVNYKEHEGAGDRGSWEIIASLALIYLDT